MHKETLEKVNFGQDGNETQRTFSTLRLLRTWPWPFCINPHHLVTKERLEHVHSSLAPTLDVSDQSLKTAFPGVLWATGSSTTCQLDTKCQTEKWKVAVVGVHPSLSADIAFAVNAALRGRTEHQYFGLSCPAHHSAVHHCSFPMWSVHSWVGLRGAWWQDYDSHAKNRNILYIYINLNLQYISTWCFACPEAWSMLQRCHLWCDPGADAEFCRLHPKILWPTGPFIDLTSCFFEVSWCLSNGFWWFLVVRIQAKPFQLDRKTRSSPRSCRPLSPRMPSSRALSSKFALGPTTCATCCNRVLDAPMLIYMGTWAVLIIFGCLKNWRFLKMGRTSKPWGDNNEMV